MTTRNRAWRRKKARAILAKVKETKEWVMQALSSKSLDDQTERRPRRPGKLTRAQALRQNWALNQEAADGF